MKRRQNWAELYEFEIDRAGRCDGVPTDLPATPIGNPFRNASPRHEASIDTQTRRATGVSRSAVSRLSNSFSPKAMPPAKKGRGPILCPIFPNPLGDRGRKKRPAPPPNGSLPASGRIRRCDGAGRGAPVQFGSHAAGCAHRRLWRKLGARSLRSLGAAPRLRRPAWHDGAAQVGLRLSPGRTWRAVRTRTSCDHCGHAASPRYRCPRDARAGQEVWIEDPGYSMTRLALSPQVRSLPDTGRPTWHQCRRRHPFAPRCACRFHNALSSVSEGVVLSMARRLSFWPGHAIRRLDCRGRLRQRFRYGGRPLASLQGLDEAERVIYIGTLNKVAFPGLRLGYAVVPRSLVRTFVAARFLSTANLRVFAKRSSPPLWRDTSSSHPQNAGRCTATSGMRWSRGPQAPPGRPLTGWTRRTRGCAALPSPPEGPLRDLAIGTARARAAWRRRSPLMSRLSVSAADDPPLPRSCFGFRAATRARRILVPRSSRPARAIGGLSAPRPGRPSPESRSSLDSGRCVS